MEGQSHQQSLWERLWPPLLVFLIYGALTVAVTWPALAQLNAAIPGSEGDALNHLWTFESVKQALLDGRSPFFTDRLYYPGGVSLLSHNIAWVHIAAWLPLQAVIGGPAAYTVVFLLIFPLNGLALFLFAREVSGRSLAAFVGGLVVAFWPYILSHHNHPNLILIAWVPLSMLFLRRLLRGGRWQDAVYTAVFLALCGLTRWQLLLMAAPLIILYGLYEIVSAEVELSWRLGGLLAGAGLGTLLLMSPLLLPIVSNQIAGDGPSSLTVPDSADRTDALAYLLPNRYHPLWGTAVSGLYDNVGVNKTYTPFLGFAALGLALLGLWKQWREARFWLGMALLYIVLALGAALRLNGADIVALPIRLLQDTIILQIVRHTDRFNVLLAVPMGMLVTYGAMSLPGIRRERARPRPYAALGFTAFVSALLLAEYVVDYPLYPLRSPAWYKQLAAEEGDFAILDLPMGSRSYDKEYMLHQLTHGKALVGGHVSRLPQEALAFIESVPLLREVLDDQQGAPDAGDVSRQLELLNRADIRYLVLHKKFLTDAQEAGWRAWMVLPPLYEDDDLLVYKTAATEFPDLPVVTGTENWPLRVINSAVWPQQLDPGALLTVDLGWGAASPVAQDFDYCLQIQGDSQQFSEQCAPLSADLPTSHWQAGELVFTRDRLAADPFWPGGNYAVTLALRNNGETTTAVPVGSFELASVERQFDAPDPQAAANITFGNAVRLAGYDLSVEDNLQLTLYWQALRRMDDSYKIFVHLTDATSGELVAQSDHIPRQWTYPTTMWEANEYVTDQVDLPLGQLPAGQYELRLGLYDSETGNRLSLVDEAGRSLAGDFITLSTIAVPPG